MPVIDISVGELFDRYTILEIKSERITDPDKLLNIHEALLGLPALPKRPRELAVLCLDLWKINEAIWDHEDTIRQCEAANRFDATFIETARAIYRNNDHRAKLKRRIDVLCGSPIMEEKSYQ